jgi:hypothetical protein
MISAGLSNFLSIAMVTRMGNTNVVFKSEGRRWLKKEYLKSVIA